jgi:hypothetical protein
MGSDSPGQLMPFPYKPRSGRVINRWILIKPGRFLTKVMEVTLRHVLPVIKTGFICGF